MAIYALRVTCRREWQRVFAGRRRPL